MSPIRQRDSATIDFKSVSQPELPANLTAVQALRILARTANELVAAVLQLQRLVSVLVDRAERLERKG